MGCCFSSCESSEASKDDSKETVYKYDNSGFAHPVIKDEPVATVSNLSKEYQTKDRLGITDSKLIIPKISVTLASPETNDNVVENEPYRPKLGLDNSAFDSPDGGNKTLNLDDFEEYPYYEPLRRMSADIREQKEKEAARIREQKEKEAARIEKEKEAIAAANIDNTNIRIATSNKVQNEGEDVIVPTKDDVDQHGKPNSIEPYKTGQRHREDSDTSFGTVYHTVVEPSEEIDMIEEEGMPVKTTVTVQVHLESGQNSFADSLPQASTIALPEDASRKFSQLAPAPKDNPLALKVGQFSVTPTEGKSDLTEENIDRPCSIPEHKTLQIEDAAASRKFSQLAAAPSNSPHAIQVGQKFTMIPTEKKHG